MSRSIKKNMGSTIACCKNIKDDRTIYHRLERARAKMLLKAIVADPEDDLKQDKVIKEKIDYNIIWADTWNWSSDGGSFIRETDKDLRIDMEALKYDQTLFYDYKCYKKNEKHKCGYFWNKMWLWSGLREISIKLAPKNLKSDEQLKKWISKNSRHIISVYKKLNYGK